MAAKFTASTQALVTALSSSYTTFSFSCWLKRTSATAAIIMFKPGTSSSRIVFTAQTHITVEQSFSVGNAIWLTDGTTTMSTDGLYHIVVIHTPSAAAPDPTVYINGVLQGISLDTPAVGTLRNPAGAYRLGNNAGATAGFDGYMEDCRIYDRALTAREVEAIYNMRGRDGIVRNLQLRYMFDEQPPGTTLDTTTVYDYGPFKRVLTSVLTSGTDVTHESTPFAISSRRRIA